MAEATDDSYIGALSYSVLYRYTLQMERFQFVYGWMTLWAKTTAHILNSPDATPRSLRLPSITNVPGVDPWTVFYHDIPTSSNEFNFLRTQVDDPTARAVELKSVIDSFTFPSFSRRTPFSLVRKIVSQNLISKCRALLSLQPISGTNAISLDRMIAKCVQNMTGLPFCPDHTILTLPLKLGGFDFPSLHRINAGIAIDGLALTDQSHLANGDCAISHALSLFKSSGNIPLDPLALVPPAPPNGHCLQLLRTMGFLRLLQIGCWTSVIGQRPNAVIRAWELDLVRSIPSRQHLAEDHIRALASNSTCPPAAHAPSTQLWGSDGSMIPAAAGILDKKSVTTALTGPCTLILKIPGRNISILQGEQMGIIMALILSDPTKPDTKPYTDHLNSVRLISDSDTTRNASISLRHMNSRSYYQWMVDLHRKSHTEILYTRGHSDESSTASLLNRDADHYASRAQSNIHKIPLAPVPTFHMDPFTFFSPADGWVKLNGCSYTDHVLAQQTSRKLDYKPNFRMLRSHYDPTPPPDFPYLRALLEALDDIAERTAAKCQEMDEAISDAATTCLLRVTRDLFMDDSSSWPLLSDQLAHSHYCLAVDEQHPTLPTKIALLHCDTNTNKAFPTHPRQAEVFQHFVGFRQNPDKHLKSYDSDFVPYSPTRPTSVPPQFRQIRRIKSPLNKYGKTSNKSYSDTPDTPDKPDDSDTRPTNPTKPNAPDRDNKSNKIKSDKIRSLPRQILQSSLVTYVAEVDVLLVNIVNNAIMCQVLHAQFQDTLDTNIKRLPYTYTDPHDIDNYLTSVLEDNLDLNPGVVVENEFGSLATQSVSQAKKD
ncbi:hypothetical protein B0H34DRAFT_678763 [Crassisporium funariophilum]|nr:hypothetical protein B0H34DRAFT_678763 [Crassisporium funariophilum]